MAHVHISTDVCMDFWVNFWLNSRLSIDWLNCTLMLLFYHFFYSFLTCFSHRSIIAQSNAAHHFTFQFNEFSINIEMFRQKKWENWNEIKSVLYKLKEYRWNLGLKSANWRQDKAHFFNVDMKTDYKKESGCFDSISTTHFGVLKPIDFTLIFKKKKNTHG